MNYTLFAVACYIVMRGLQVLFIEYLDKLWYKAIIKSGTVAMLYAALASLVVWYHKINLLGSIGINLRKSNHQLIDLIYIIRTNGTVTIICKLIQNFSLSIFDLCRFKRGIYRQFIDQQHHFL